MMGKIIRLGGRGPCDDRPREKAATEPVIVDLATVQDLRQADPRIAEGAVHLGRALNAVLDAYRCLTGIG